MHSLTLLVLLLLQGSGSTPAKDYPEVGKVVAISIERIPRTAWQAHRYRVETDGAVYEFRDWNYGDRATLKIGDTVEFRVDGDRVYVRTGGKARKYLLSLTESKRHG